MGSETQETSARLLMRGYKPNPGDYELIQKAKGAFKNCAPDIRDEMETVNRVLEKNPGSVILCIGAPST